MNISKAKVRPVFRNGAGGISGILILLLAAVTLVSCSRTKEFYVKRGTESMGKGEFRKAIDDFEEALKLGESGYLLYQAIAESHSKLGNIDEAIENYLEAAELLKNSGEKISREATLAQGVDERQRLRYLLEERIGPVHSQVYTQLGMLYSMKSNHAKAVIAYELAIHYRERNLRARLELARLFERKRDTEAALREYRRFVKDAGKAPREDRMIYEINKADIEIARRHIEKLSLGQSSEETDEEQEK